MIQLRRCRESNLTFYVSALVAAVAFVACEPDAPVPSEGELSSSGGSASLGPDVNGPIVIPRSPEQTTANDDLDPTVIALQLCETESGYSVSSLDGDPLFDDFEDGDNGVSSNGRVGTWYTYGDATGTLFPPGDWAADSPGRAGSSFALHAGGKAFTEWGSGTGITLARDAGGRCLHDLSAYTGVTFWARGEVLSLSGGTDRDQGVVRLMFTEADVTPVTEGGGCDGSAGECWDSHRVRLSLSPCWVRHSFDFAEFKQDGWGQDGAELNLDQLYNLGFEVAANNDWDLWVDDISFYVGDKPEAAEDCVIDTGLGGASGQL